MDRFPDGNADAPPDRPQRRRQRDQQRHRRFQQQYSWRQFQAAGIEIEHAGDKLGDFAGRQGAQRRRHKQGQQPVNGHQGEIELDNLILTRANDFQDADLPRLLRQDRRDGVDQQQAAQNQGKSAENRQQ